MRRKDWWSMGNGIETDRGIQSRLWKWAEESKLPTRPVAKDAEGKTDGRQIVEFVFSHFEKFSPKIKQQIEVLQKSFRALGFTDDEAKAILAGDSKAGAKRLVERGKDFEKRSAEAKAEKKPAVAQNLLEQAQRAYQLALGVEPKDAAAHRALADLFYRQGEGKNARVHTGMAVRYAGVKEIPSLIVWLQTLPDPALKNSKGLDFVATNLIEVRRYDDAKNLYEGAARAQSDAAKAQKFREKALLVEEMGGAFAPAFNEKTNSTVTRLHAALRAEGIPGGLMAGDPVEGKAARELDAIQVLAFVDKNGEDPRVQKALKECGLTQPKLKFRDAADQEAFARLSFSHKQSLFHQRQAEAATSTKDLEKHLAAAAHFDPGSTALAKKLEDLPVERKNFIKNAEALESQGKTAEARRLYTLAYDLDPTNPTANRKLAEFLYHDAENESDPGKKSSLVKGARDYVARAMTHENDSGALVKLALLMEKSDKKAFPAPWDKIGNYLRDQGKISQARDLFQAAGVRTTAIAQAADKYGDAAGSKKLSDRALLYFDQSQVLSERLGPPYIISLSHKEERTRAILSSAQAQEVPLATLNKKDASNRQITSTEIHSYIEEGIKKDDPRTLVILLGAKDLENRWVVPRQWLTKGGQLKPEFLKKFKETGFGKTLADYHTGEAKRLAGPKGTNRSRQVLEHLLAAVEFDGKNAERYEAVRAYEVKGDNVPVISQAIYYSNEKNLKGEAPSTTFFETAYYKADDQWEKSSKSLKVEQIEDLLAEKLELAKDLKTFGKMEEAKALLGQIQGVMENFYKTEEGLLKLPTSFVELKATLDLSIGRVFGPKHYSGKAQEKDKGDDPAKSQAAYQSVVALTTHLLQKSPQNLDALVMRANTQRILNNPKAALADYHAAMKISGGEAALRAAGLDEEGLKGEGHQHLLSDFRQELAHFKSNLRPDKPEEKKITDENLARLEKLGLELKDSPTVSNWERMEVMKLLHEFYGARIQYLQAYTEMAYKGEVEEPKALTDARRDPYAALARTLSKGAAEVADYIKDPKAYEAKQNTQKALEFAEATKNEAIKQQTEALKTEKEEKFGAYWVEHKKMEWEMEALREKVLLEADNSKISFPDRINSAQTAYEIDKALGDHDGMVVSLGKWQELAIAKDEWLDGDPKERLNQYGQIIQGIRALQAHYDNRVHDFESKSKYDEAKPFREQESRLSGMKSSLIYGMKGANGFKEVAEKYAEKTGLDWDKGAVDQMIERFYDHDQRDSFDRTRFFTGPGIEEFLTLNKKAKENIQTANRVSDAFGGGDPMASRALLLEALDIYGRLGNAPAVNTVYESIVDETNAFVLRKEEKGEFGSVESNVEWMNVYAQMGEALRGKGIPLPKEEKAEREKAHEEAWKTVLETKAGHSEWRKKFHASQWARAKAELTFDAWMSELARAKANKLSDIYISMGPAEVRGVLAARIFYQQDGNQEIVQQLDKNLKESFAALETRVELFVSDSKYHNEYQTSPDLRMTTTEGRKAGVEEAVRLVHAYVVLIQSEDLIIKEGDSDKVKETKNKERQRLGQKLLKLVDHVEKAIAANSDLPADFQFEQTKQLGAMLASFKGDLFTKGNPPMIKASDLEQRTQAALKLVERSFEANSHVFYADLSGYQHLIDQMNAHGLPSKIKDAVIGYYIEQNKLDKDLRSRGWYLTPADWKEIEKIQSTATNTGADPSFEINQYLILQGKHRELTDTETNDRDIAQKLMKGRFEEAVKTGDAAYLANMTVESLHDSAVAIREGFLEKKKSEDSNLTLDQRKNHAFQAAGIFAELDLDVPVNGEKQSLVNQTLEPFLKDLDKIENPVQRAIETRIFVEFYKHAEMDKEAKIYLQKIVDLAPKGAPGTDADKALQFLAFSAQGEMHLIGDDMDLDKAKEFFQKAAKLDPNNEAILTFLEQIELIQYQHRVALPQDVLSGVLMAQVDYLKGKKRGTEYDLGDEWKKSDEFLIETRALLIEVRELCSDGDMSVTTALKTLRGNSKYSNVFKFLEDSGPGKKTLKYIETLGNPAFRDDQISGETLRLVENLRKGDNFGAAMNVASVLINDPFVSKQAKKEIKDKIPQAAEEYARWQAWKDIFKTILIVPLIAEGRFKEAAFEGLSTLALTVFTMGIGTAFKVGAKAARGAWMARSAMKAARAGVAAGRVGMSARLAARFPRAYKAMAFTMDSLADEIGENLGEMAGKSLLTGQNQFSWSGLYQQVRAGLPSKMLIHGSLRGVKGLERWAKVASKGQEIKTVYRVGLSAAKHGSMVGSFAVGGIISEELGWSPKQNISGVLRLAESFIQHAKYSGVNKGLNLVSGGRIEKYEHKLDQRERLIPALTKLNMSAVPDTSKMNREEKKAAKDLAKAQEEAMVGFLIHYSEARAAKKGKPLSETELANEVMRLNQSALPLLQKAGLKSGTGFEMARLQLFTLAAQEAHARGVSADKILAKYAMGIPDPKALDAAVDQVVMGSKFSAEDREAVKGMVLTWAMQNADSGEAFATHLQQFAMVAPKISASLQAGVDSLLGPGGSKTKEGKLLFESALFRSLDSVDHSFQIQAFAEDFAKWTPAIRRQMNDIRTANPLPGDKSDLALLDFVLRNGFGEPDLKFVLGEVRDGKKEFAFDTEGNLKVLEVPVDQQEARKKLVAEREAKANEPKGRIDVVDASAESASDQKAIIDGAVKDAEAQGKGQAPQTWKTPSVRDDAEQLAPQAPAPGTPGKGEKAPAGNQVHAGAKLPSDTGPQRKAPSNEPMKAQDPKSPLPDQVVRITDSQKELAAKLEDLRKLDAANEDLNQRARTGQMTAKQITDESTSIADRKQKVVAEIQALIAQGAMEATQAPAAKEVKVGDVLTNEDGKGIGIVTKIDGRGIHLRGYGNFMSGMIPHDQWGKFLFKMVKPIETATAKEPPPSHEGATGKDPARRDEMPLVPGRPPPAIIPMSGRNAAETQRFSADYQVYESRVSQNPAEGLPNKLQEGVRSLVEASAKDGNEHRVFAIEFADGTVVVSDRISADSPFNVKNQDGMKSALGSLLDNAKAQVGRGNSPVKVYDYHTHPRRGKLHPDGRLFTETNTTDTRSWDAAADFFRDRFGEMGVKKSIVLEGGAVPVSHTEGKQAPTKDLPYIATYRNEVQTSSTISFDTYNNKKFRQEFQLGKSAVNDPRVADLHATVYETTGVKKRGVVIQASEDPNAQTWVRDPKTETWIQLKPGAVQEVPVGKSLEVRLGKSLQDAAPIEISFDGKNSPVLKVLAGSPAETSGLNSSAGVAQFKPLSDVQAKAAKIAQAAPSRERVKRYYDHLVNVKKMDTADAALKAWAWADQVIIDARAHQSGRTHIYDTSLPVSSDTAHLDASTVDHHGRFANPKNSTEQLVDKMESVLAMAKADPKALEAASKDDAAMAAARHGFKDARVRAPTEKQVREVAAAIRELNLKEVTTDNLADGGWSVWIAKNQARVFADPALRKLVLEATHFEDFTAFGTTYDPSQPGIRMQAALFQKYGEILKSNGIVGSDRFAPAQADKVMVEALAAIDAMVADPAARETAATEFFAKVEEAKKAAAERGVIADASIHQGDTQLTFFDLTKLGDFTVFQQWLALPRVSPGGKDDTIQVSVVPMKALEANIGGQTVKVDRKLQIVAIPNGRELPSKNGLLPALDAVNQAELAKAEALGLVPKEGETPKAGQLPRDHFGKLWFGKDNVILPNPMKGGSLLNPQEVSAILSDRASSSAKLGLFSKIEVVPSGEVTGKHSPAARKRADQAQESKSSSNNVIELKDRKRVKPSEEAGTKSETPGKRPAKAAYSGDIAAPISEHATPTSAEHYWDPRARIYDEMLVGKLIEYYSSEGTREALEGMARRSDHWGEDAKKFQESLKEVEAKSREYFELERKFKSQTEADADPVQQEKFRDLVKLAEGLEKSPYNKLEQSHLAMIRELGKELWHLENALAKIQIQDLGQEFAKGRTEASFDFQIVFTPVETLADYRGQWKSLDTSKLASAHVTVDNWAKAEKIIQDLQQDKVKVLKNGQEVTQNSLEGLEGLSKSADGQSGKVSVTIKGPPTHRLTLNFKIRAAEVGTKTGTAANDNSVVPQPIAAAAGAGDSIVTRAVPSEPSFDGRSGHDWSHFKANLPADYYETVRSSDTQIPMQGGLLVPQAAGDPPPSTGMLWKVKSVDGDRILLEQGRRFQGEEKKPTAVSGEIFIKLDGASRFHPGDEVRFIPPVAGGSGDRSALKELHLPEGMTSVVIGRDHNSSQITLGGAQVSRNHATIERGTDGKWYLLDGTRDAQGVRTLSRNGVKVWDGYQEVPVGREHWFPLADGQPIRIGEHWMVFRTPTVEVGRATPRTASQPKTVRLNAQEVLGADLASVMSGQTFLADQIDLPGVRMTPELRKELKRAEELFEHGGSVNAMKGGTWMLIERTSGADTISGKPTRPEVKQFYDIWKSQRSFSPVDASQAKQAWSDLQTRSRQLGIQINLGAYQPKNHAELEQRVVEHGAEVAYLNELLKLLPDSMLQSNRLKMIHFNVPRTSAGLLSSYDPATNSVSLYTGSFNGSRRHMAALFLHELGHPAAERYQAGPDGDPSIPLPVRQKMVLAHSQLSRSNAMLGLDWADGGTRRAKYQENFTEFLAEFNMMYVTAGPKLRQHIESFPKDSPERRAWEFVYSEMRDRIFQGREYDYAGIQPQQPVQPVRSQKPALDVTQRDWNSFSEQLQTANIALNRVPQSMKEFDIFVGDPALLVPQAGPAVVTSAFSAGEVPRHLGKFVQDGEGWRYFPNGEQSIFGADYRPRALETDGGLRLREGDILTLGYSHFQFLQGELRPRLDQAGFAPGPLHLHIPDPVVAAARGQAGDFVERNPPAHYVDAQILAGSVDLEASIPIRINPATAENGEFAGVTTQGAGYKPVNEDAVLSLRGPNGKLLLLDIDGMGGHGNGDVAALLVAEAFSSEYSRSGDTGQAWKLANASVMRFNGAMKEGLKIDQAMGEARKIIADPTLVGQGRLSDGAGAVAVMLEQSPPTREGDPSTIRFEWVGDGRAMQLRPDTKGRLQWIYKTVDEGFPSMPGLLKPGVDYSGGGFGKTLVGQIHPQANVVTNAIGTRENLKVKGTQDGETPNANDPSGSVLVGEAYRDGIALQPKDWVILGSDGFWENFGRTELILNIMDKAKSAEDATRLLTEEAHWRMDILSQAKSGSLPKTKSGRYRFEKAGGIYYIDNQGRWRKTTHLEIDKRGAVYEPGETKPVDHFKNDNFSLVVYQHNPNSDPTSRDVQLPIEGRFGHGPKNDGEGPSVYGQAAMEMKVKGSGDGSVKDLQDLQKGQGERQAVLLKDLQAQGPVEGSARSYAANEFPELLHLVLERGQPIEVLPSAKGIRGKVEDHMYAFVVEVERRFPQEWQKAGKQDPLTGESFQIRDQQGKMKQNIPSLYRFAKRLMNEKLGLPVQGEASPRQQEAVLGFVEGALGRKNQGNYQEAAIVLRDEFRRLSPEFQKAYKAADEKMRTALLDTLLDGKRFTTFTDRGEAMRLVRFLGKTGYHLEFGLTADLSKHPAEYLLALGDLSAAINPRPGLVALIHSHPKLYVNRRHNLMGHRDTLDVGSGREVGVSASLLFSEGDLVAMLKDAEKLTKEGAVLPGFLEAGVYRNWVQHSYGISEAEIRIGTDGKVTEMKIHYGIYHGFSGLDGSHTAVIKQLHDYAKKTFPDVKVTIQEASTKSIEANIPGSETGAKGPVEPP